MNSKWILIVEDEAEFAENLKIKLTQDSLKPLISLTATDAVTKLANQKVDLIVLDIRLGDESGEKVIMAIKKNKNHLNFKTPIMVISGELDVDLVTRIRADIQSVMVKPFDLNEFATKVKALVK